MSCKYCQNYKIDEAMRQVYPTLLFEITCIKSICKVCKAEYIADFQEHKLHKVGELNERATAS